MYPSRARKATSDPLPGSRAGWMAAKSLRNQRAIASGRGYALPTAAAPIRAPAAEKTSNRGTDPMSITRIDPGPRFCQAVVHGNTVYLAGQVADNPVPSVAKQTAQVLKRIDKYLKAAGTNKSKLLSVNIWLSDIRTFDEMNAEWEKWVSKDSKPVRATVEGRLAAPKYLVEIMCVAAK